MSKSAPRLGKGLSTLLAPTTHALSQPHSIPVPALPRGSELSISSAAVVDLPLEQLHPNPKQPRIHVESTTLEGLADSIRQNGVLQPILVRRTADHQYEIVAGERRWRAAQLAEQKTIPAIIRELSDAESFELALIENLQREDLTPIERATAYQQLIDTLGLIPEQLAKRIGESRANIVNYMRLLKLHPKVQGMISHGELSMGQARPLAGLNNPQRQLAIALLTIRRNLSVRQVEQLAQTSSEAAPEGNTSEIRQAKSQNLHLEDIQSSLSKAIGMPVTVKLGKKKNSGRIIINYNSLEEFDRIAERLGGKACLE